MASLTVLPRAKIIAVVAIIHALPADCWTFNSMSTGNSKMLDIWDSDEGLYPVPYEKTNSIDIDEENPPSPPQERVAFTFPETKWCGPGNIASDYHDLGERNETDKCCREHDYCDDIIPAGHSAHGLVNDEFYTKLNCGCDEKFHSCLHKSTDGIGDIIGKVYFNVIGTQCFRLDYPIKRCIQYRGIIRKKCKEYEFDTSKPQKYQWFDVPQYVKS